MQKILLNKQLNDKMKGEMPIKAWIEIHIEEIKANWELAKNSERLFKIKPLS